MSIAFKPRRMVLHIHNVACMHFLFHCSYSLYEPKDIVLSIRVASKRLFLRIALY